MYININKILTRIVNQLKIAQQLERGHKTEMQFKIQKNIYYNLQVHWRFMSK